MNDHRTMDSRILSRLLKYCAGAEKSTHDVLGRLQAWEIPAEDHDGIIKKLKDEKFLDDTRFARCYVSDKWNLDHWGKLKIQNALNQKDIDEATILDALKNIDDQEYKNELHEILRKKWKEVKSPNDEDDVKRILMYAISRGFEEELIMEWINQQSFNLGS